MADYAITPPNIAGPLPPKPRTHAADSWSSAGSPTGHSEAVGPADATSAILRPVGSARTLEVSMQNEAAG
jgi:hypothetical protein